MKTVCSCFLTIISKAIHSPKSMNSQRQDKPLQNYVMPGSLGGAWVCENSSGAGSVCRYWICRARKSRFSNGFGHNNSKLLGLKLKVLILNVRDIDHNLYQKHILVRNSTRRVNTAARGRCLHWDLSRIQPTEEIRAQGDHEACTVQENTVPCCLVTSGERSPGCQAEQGAFFSPPKGDDQVCHPPGSWEGTQWHRRQCQMVSW